MWVQAATQLLLTTSLLSMPAGLAFAEEVVPDVTGEKTAVVLQVCIAQLDHPSFPKEDCEATRGRPSACFFPLGTSSFYIPECAFHSLAPASSHHPPAGTLAQLDA